MESQAEAARRRAGVGHAVEAWGGWLEEGSCPGRGRRAPPGDGGAEVGLWDEGRWWQCDFTQPGPRLAAHSTSELCFIAPVVGEIHLLLLMRVLVVLGFTHVLATLCIPEQPRPPDGLSSTSGDCSVLPDHLRLPVSFPLQNSRCLQRPLRQRSLVTGVLVCSANGHKLVNPEICALTVLRSRCRQGHTLPATA